MLDGCLSHSLTSLFAYLCGSAGRDPRGMDTRGQVTTQRVPMAPNMQGPVSHGMGPNAPPPSRPVPAARKQNIPEFFFF